MRPGREIRIVEDLDRRYLGAVRFRDGATDAVIRRAMKIESRQLDFLVNRSQLHVITRADGFEQHLDAFDPVPADPAGPVNFELSVIDPLGRYLPRLATLQLPRSQDRQAADSVFTPVDFALFQAPSAPTGPNWSVIRATVRRQAAEETDRTPVRGALLRVLDDNGALLRRALTDERGEALVALPGIQVTDFSREPLPPLESDGEEEDEEELDMGPVVVLTTAVDLEVVVADATPWPVDPDQLEAERATLTRAVTPPEAASLQVEARQTQSVELFVTLPANE